MGELFTSQVLAGISIDVANLAEDHRRQKHIPADFKQSFINDLLSSGICICGCDLQKNSDQYRKVQSRLNEGALEGTEESWTKLAVDVAGIDSQFASLKQMFNALSGKIDSEDQAIVDLSDKLSKFDEGIETVAAGTNAGEAIVALESERNGVLAESLELTRKREQKLESLNACKKEIADCDREMRKLKPKNEEAKLHLKRRNYLSLVEELVDDEFLKLKESLREDLEMSITTMFRSLSNNPYFAELDKDFGLRLCIKDEAGNSQQVALGTGETQLMYYSFVAALSQLNFEKSQKSKNINQSFPIMIDAPFSYLDSELSTRVAKNLPAVTHQVVFLNFQKELPTMTEKEVANAVGEVSILKLHVEKDPTVKPNANEIIELPQGSFDYVVAKDTIKRYTEIVSVSL
jgi:DNA sulfur modification protein DndD